MRGLEDALQKAFDGEQKAPMEQENNYFDDWAHFAQKEQNMQSHTKHQRQAQVHAVVHTIVARVKMQYDIDQAAKIKVRSCS